MDNEQLEKTLKLKDFETAKLLNTGETVKIDTKIVRELTKEFEIEEADDTAGERRFMIFLIFVILGLLFCVGTTVYFVITLLF